MNYKKLTIGITAVNIFGLAMIELWGSRYADTNICVGAGFIIFVHIIGYYIIVLSAHTPIAKEGVTPQNCKEHDWQPHKYSDRQEQCVRCGAERGK